MLGVAHGRCIGLGFPKDCPISGDCVYIKECPVGEECLAECPPASLYRETAVSRRIHSDNQNSISQKGLRILKLDDSTVIQIDASGNVIAILSSGDLLSIPRLLSRVRSCIAKQSCETPDASTETLGARYSQLTPREREVAKQLIGGNNTKQIARDLAISPRTVEYHRSNLFKKMEVKSVVELTRLLLGNDS